MESFYDFYTLAGSSDNLEQEFTSEEKGKQCIFCGKSYPDIRFLSKPHLLPELFGRNNTLYNYECDACNSAFNFHETQMSTFIQPFISIMGIKTKKGIPVFQSRKTADQNATTVRVNGQERIFYLGTNLSDMVFDYEKKSIKATFRSRPFIPFSVYKLLLKIAIALLPQVHRLANPHYLDFLHSNNPVYNNMQHWTLYRYVMKGKMFGSPAAKLFRANQLVVGEEEFPEFCLMLTFANVTLQFFLPITQGNVDIHDKNRSLRFELHPSFIFEDITKLKEVRMELLDLDVTEKISVDETMVMYYKHIDSMPSDLEQQ